MIRVGVVGFGLAGRIFHAAVINAVEGLELAAIVARSGSAASEAYPHVPVVRSVDALLSDRSIRVIIVATPNDTHAPIARQCLLADRDVVIDKPFALSSAEAAELIQLARARKRLLSVYQSRRWDGDFKTVGAILKSGELGKLVQFESHMDRFRPEPNLGRWREDGSPGGGILLDLGSHLVDQALVWFGLPEAVWADVRIEREGGRVDDAFDLWLHYAARTASPDPPNVSNNGLVAWLRATCVSRSPGPRFTLNGMQGTFRKFGIDPQEDRLRAGDLFQSHPWGIEPEDQWGTLTTDAGGKSVSRRIPTEPGDYRGFYANLRDTILGTATLAVTPEQAWQTMRVLEMARESSQARSVVSCDWSQEAIRA
jgi:predicted dehydrogenase